jgi:hypothetical protein
LYYYLVNLSTSNNQIAIAPIFNNMFPNN